MKIILFADLHLHASWYERCDEFLSWLSSKINDIKPDFLVFLGDLFEEKDRILNRVKRRVIDFLESPNIPTCYWLLGNHDFATLNATALDWLEPWGMVIKEPQIIEIGGKSILFLPYGSRYPEKEKVDYIFMHDIVEGFTLPSGYTFEKGVPKDYLKVFSPKKIFSGHIHIPVHNGFFYYIGSPIERDFRDGVTNHFQPFKRGIYVLDTFSDTVDFHEFKSLRFVHIKVESVKALKAKLQLLRKNFIEQGYPVSLWVEQVAEFDLPDFDKDVFFSCIVAKKVDDVPEVVLEKQLGDLRQVIEKFVPEKFKNKEKFWEYGKKVFSQIGVNL